MERPGDNRKRDTVIIGGVLIITLIAYVLFKTPERVPVPDSRRGTVSRTANAGMGLPDDLPSSYDSLVIAGNRCMDDGNFAMAAESYRRALALDGSSPDVRTDFGACLHALGLSEKAIEEFRTVLSNNPSHSTAHFNLGIVFYQLGRTDSARHYWKEYLRLDPTGRAAEMAEKLLKDLDG
jgi:tetratricopeptide (TPR) repeat protein